MENKGTAELFNVSQFIIFLALCLYVSFLNDNCKSKPHNVTPWQFYVLAFWHVPLREASLSSNSFVFRNATEETGRKIKMFSFFLPETTIQAGENLLMVFIYFLIMQLTVAAQYGIFVRMSTFVGVIITVRLYVT